MPCHRVAILSCRLAIFSHSCIPHQQKQCSSRGNGSLRVDALRLGYQRHPGGGCVPARHQCHTSRCISLFEHSFTISSHSVGLRYSMNTLVLWPTVTIHRTGFTVYTLHSDCNTMSDAANTSLHVPSTCAQIAILSFTIIHIIPSHQINLAIDNASLFLSVSCLIAGSYLWNYLCAADNVSHTEYMQSNRCRCISHSYEFHDGIQVTQVSRYWGKRHG